MDWKSYQESLGPVTPPTGSDHYAEKKAAEMDFEPRESSRTGSAIVTGVCIGVAVIGACAWLLVMRSCDLTASASAWVL